MQQQALILSIDGGGIRGLISAAFLASLEKDLTKSLYDTFDIYAGSSVGSFITLAISALKYDGQQILSLFSEANIKAIFSRSLLNMLAAFYKPKYNGKGKHTVLAEIFGEHRFLNIKKPTLITAYDIIDKRAVVFKSHDKNNRDTAYNPLISEVADASSAAPTYFPTVPTSQKPPRWLIDGGISANNPAMCAIVEALHLGYAAHNIKILSLGSGRRDRMQKDPQKYGKSSQSWGGLGWLKHGIIDDLFSGNSTTIEYEAEQLLKANYFRVDHSLAPANDDLDNIKAANVARLIEKGQHWYESCRKDLLAWLGTLA